MVSAVVYKSNSGSCEKYARKIGEALNVPVYEAAHCPLARGREVVYVSWLLNGTAYGYKLAEAFFLVRAVVAVGMSAPSEKTVETLRAKDGIPAVVPVFALQGGFDINELPHVFALMMKLVNPKIVEKIENLKKTRELTAEETACYNMAKNGYGEPASWDGIDAVIDALKAAKV